MKHIPNILSVIRIAMIPFFVWQFFKGNTFNAGLLLAASGVTDFLDGTLARRFGWITQLGKVLDPIADKLTLVTVSVVLIIQLKEYRVFFIILLVKDFIMLVLGGYLIKNKVTLQGAKWFGKVATIAFYAAMITLALFQEKLPHQAIVAMLVVVTTLELISALFYVPDFFRYMGQRTKMVEK